MGKKRKKQPNGAAPREPVLPFKYSPAAKKLITGLFLLAVILSFFLRFYDLELKPLHHDEGVNSWFLLNLKADFPGGWTYDPSNYHGPFLFFTHIIPLAIHESVFSLRCMVALFGSLTLLLLWPLRRKIGRVGVTAAAFLLAISPSHLFFSRTNIHEIYLVFFTLGTVVAAVRLWETKKPFYLVLAFACWAWVITVKETYIITAGSWFWAAVGTYLWFAVTRKTDEIPPRAAAKELGGWLKVHYAAIWLAAGVFVLIIVVYYSSLFTTLKGTTKDLVQSLLIWQKTGTKGAGHEKPFFYWWWLLRDFELPIFILGVLGIGLAAVKRNAFAVFCVIWTVMMFLIHSGIAYKTPWLALNFILPLALLGGFFLEGLYRSLAKNPALVGAAGVLFAGGLVAWGTGISRTVNFIEYDDDRHMIVYSQTRRDLNDLVAAIEEYAHKQGQGYTTEIKIVSDEYWPLQWYLREYPRVGFWGKVLPDSDAPIVIGRSTTQDELERALQDTYYSELYSVRPGLDLYLYTRLHRGKVPEEELPPPEPVEVVREDLRPALVGSYFNKVNPVGEPTDTRIEDRFEFWYNSPAETRAGLGLSPPLSILWDGLIEITRGGNYVFATESDDGSWLFIDERLVVDNGGAHAVQYRSGEVTLEEGFHRIRIKYFDVGGGAVLKVFWTPPGEKEEPIPPRRIFHQKR
ncbi:MAG: TIGR03663 family protein [Candidatus Erginobacter occultus]|nr:TIGR03663 family protein [Candidatus Erginobacter occultus]